MFWGIVASLSAVLRMSARLGRSVAMSMREQGFIPARVHGVSAARHCAGDCRVSPPVSRDFAAEWSGAELVGVIPVLGLAAGPGPGRQGD